MDGYSREESIFGFSGPMARIAAAAILLAGFAKIPFEELREIAKKNQTPLLFVSPAIPSLHQVTTVLSPGS